MTATLDVPDAPTATLPEFEPPPELGGRPSDQAIIEALAAENARLNDQLLLARATVAERERWIERHMTGVHSTPDAAAAR